MTENIRTIVVLTDFPSLAEMEADVEAVRSAIVGEPREAENVGLEIGNLDAGWLEFAVAADGQRLEWNLTNVGDPFDPGIGWRDSGGIEHNLIRWLEQIIEGGSPALFLDLEGPTGVMVVTPLDGTKIRVTGAHSSLIALDIGIDRVAFVRDVYRGLVAFWESARFGEHWHDWTFDGRERWSIRSELIEKAIG